VTHDEELAFLLHRVPIKGFRVLRLHELLEGHGWTPARLDRDLPCVFAPAERLAVLQDCSAEGVEFELSGDFLNGQ